MKTYKRCPCGIGPDTHEHNKPDRTSEIERLANSKLVMGWKKLNGNRQWQCKFDYYKWDPFKKLDDAMMVAEKIGLLNLRHATIKNSWIAYLGGCKFSKYGQTAAEAIALAAIAYLDWKEKQR